MRLTPTARALAVALALMGDPVRAESLATPAWHLQLGAVQHSDPLPLARFDTDDYAQALQARHRRDLAYLDHELRLSHTRGAHRFSLLTRQRATLIASRDAVELAADAETSGRPAGDRRWSVRGRYLAFAGSGLAWQTRFTPATGWQLDLGAQGLVLDTWRERHIDGSASYQAASDAYQFDLQSFEASDQLRYPYQRSFAARGQALLLNGQLRWSGEQHAAHIAWQDLGWLRWQGVPQNTSVLSTNTQTLDANGFVVYQPLIQGQNSQAGRRRSAPARVTLAGEWRPTPATTLAARGEWLQHFGVLPALSAEHRVGDATWGLTWHTHERRVTASVVWHGLQLRVGADRLGDQAHSRELMLGGAWQF